MAQFDYFVVLAEMRTGSNLLEAYLNSFDGLSCEGEVFNPAFVAYPKIDALYGVTRAARDADPLALLAQIADQPGLNGFRYFHDHDPRVFDTFMRDPRCAKIVLTRNPLESYVSLKIARETQQWRLGDVKNKRAAQVVFDPVEFADHVTELQGFQTRVQHVLQTTGQTAFYIGYEDIKDLDIINGLAGWLGLTERVVQAPRRMKRQNPEPLEEKLLNPEAVSDGIARLDRFNLSRTPNFEPRQSPPIGAFRACARTPLIHAPIPGGNDRAIHAWMAQIDGVAPDALLRDFTPRAWHDWQAAHPQRVAFSVLRHPLARAHETFVRQVILGKRVNVRAFIERVHGVRLPADAEEARGWANAEHRAGFLGYLHFVQANLAGQTALPTRAIWASQSRLIEAIVTQCPPHRLIRAERLAEDLPALGGELGQDLPEYAEGPGDLPLDLAAIHDAALDTACRAAYTEDYLRLGFGDWAR
ncbi:MAG: nodulation protein NodH [Rhodobacteraceae bacterium]|nr:nodulation protein NodH [Paracoccaceae bacterium]